MVLFVVQRLGTFNFGSDCSEPCPVEFQMSAKMENLQLV